jgi:UDP-GlcNAc:undecaprenyl-phosphate/decaprenyl-phosphate GlcNAc-1-phosphate transferase
MYSLVILTITALLLSVALTPLARNWSIRLGLVDRPDGGRKVHNGAMPRTGGVPILVSYAGAYAILLVLPLHAGGLLLRQSSIIWSLLPPVAIIFLTGLLDDWLNLRPWHKLAGEFAAAVWAWEAGVRILGLAGMTPTPWWSLLLTVAWLILCSNAFNLIDGVDGLATGVGITATLTIMVAGLLHGDVALGLATAPLAGCLIGFLRYNFNPASIFLGDSGSLLIGFLLGSYGIIWSQKSATMLGVAAPAMALGLPLLEVGLSIVRRFVRNDPILEGDRGHIHHRLLDRGFTPRRVALLLYGACGVGATLSLLQSVVHGSFAGLGIVFFAGVTWVGVRYLGYAEFEAARRFLAGAFRPMLSAHVKLELLERSLVSASTIEECWFALEQAARSLGYSHMTVRMGPIRFATAPDRARDGSFWQFRLNLEEDCWVNITQQEGRAEQPILLIPFSEVVRRVLPGKIAELCAGRADFGGQPEASLAHLATAVASLPLHSSGRNSKTTTVMSSDCGAPSVNAATAS